MNGTQRRTLVIPLRYCGMPKGTSWAEVTLNSEKIKPVVYPLSSYAVLKASGRQALS